MKNEKLKSTLMLLLRIGVVTAGFFAWWLSMFLLISLFALSVWSPKLTDLVAWSLMLTGVSLLIYLVVLFKRRR